VRLRNLKVYVFSETTLATLATTVNSFTAGAAAGGYSAGTVKEQTLIHQDVFWNGTAHCAILWYAE
jgi:hypothetical protein